jgi:hypothetical protein
MPAILTTCSWSYSIFERKRNRVGKRVLRKDLAPRARFELATLRLTAECSAVELPGNGTVDWKRPKKCKRPLSRRQRDLDTRPRLAVRASLRHGEIESASISNCETCLRGLLQSLRRGIVHDQIFENCEDVPAIAHDLFEEGAQRRLVLGFAVPLGQDRCRHLDIAPQLLSRVPAQEEAVEKGRLSLRELEILQPLI